MKTLSIGMIETWTLVQQVAPSSHVTKNHPTNCIISNLHSGITTRKKDCLGCLNLANIGYTSPLEPVSVT